LSNKIAIFVDVLADDEVIHQKYQLSPNYFWSYGGHIWGSKYTSCVWWEIFNSN